MQPDIDRSRESDQAEIRLMGLILTQAVSIGIAVGVYDAGLWLNLETPTINGITYAMAAFAVQGLAYYFFKMFFEQQMQERVQMAELQRSRTQNIRQTQMTFDQRRSELEMRMQEAQLENELRWMSENPDKVSPSFNGSNFSGLSKSQDYHNTFNPGLVPTHGANGEKPLELGLNRTADNTSTTVIPPRKKDGTPDLRYRSPREDN